MITKKELIELADALKQWRPIEGCHSGRGVRHSERCFSTCEDFWRLIVQSIADACARSNPRFKKQSWLDYIAGKCGPNGGKLS